MEKEMIPEAPVDLHGEEESIGSEELGSGDVIQPDAEEPGIEQEEDAAAAVEAPAGAPGSEEELGEAASKPAIVGGSSPSDASSEWPSEDIPAPPPPYTSFFLFKVLRPRENREFKVKIQAERTKLRIIYDKLNVAKATKRELLQELTQPRANLKAVRDALNAKFGDLNSVKERLKTTNLNQELPGSEEELDNRIAELRYNLQHGTQSLKQEKAMMKDIQTLKDSRGLVLDNAAKKLEIEGLRQQREPLTEEIAELKKEREKFAEENAPLEAQLNKLTAEIKELEKQRDLVSGTITELQAEERERNTVENNDYQEFLRDGVTANNLALERNKQAVEEFCAAQVDRHLVRYCNDPVFRAEYVARNEESTVWRFSTLDARTLEPGERRITVGEVRRKQREAEAEVVAEAEAAAAACLEAEAIKEAAKRKPDSKEVPAKPAKTGAKEAPRSGAREAAVAKPSVKLSVKEAAVAKAGWAKDSVPVKAKARAETEKPAPPKKVEKEPEPEPEAVEEEEEEEEVVDEEAERQKRREESIEKARLAEVRKKRRAEKKEKLVAARLDKEKQRKEEKKQRKANGVADEAASNSTEEGGEEAPPAAEAAGVANGSVGAEEEEGEEAPEVAINSKKNTNNSSNKNKSNNRNRKAGGKVVKSQVNVRPPYKKKRSLQGQLLDYWQYFVGALLVMLIFAGTAMTFVHA